MHVYSQYTPLRACICVCVCVSVCVCACVSVSGLIISLSESLFVNFSLQIKNKVHYLAPVAYKYNKVGYILFITH